jgi:antitoxin CptB
MSGDLSERRKKLLYRSAYTGTKETDLLLGAFARRHLASLSETQLDTYETLLKIEDPRLYKWITGMEEAPAEYQTDVLELIRDFKYME